MPVYELVILGLTMIVMQIRDLRGFENLVGLKSFFIRLLMHM